MIKASQEMCDLALTLYPSGWRVARALGGSDGAVFELVGPEGSAILKLMEADATEMPRVRAREAFRAYVGQHGVPVAALLPALDGDPVPCFEAGGLVLAAMLYARVKGQPPDLDAMLNSGRLAQWGQLIGRMHALSPGFEAEALASWEDECRVFADWCQEEAIRARWEQMRLRLEGLSQESSAYGVVHNDLHCQNLILSPTGLTAIDFSVCCYHWFCTDIGVAVFLWAWLGKPLQGETRGEMLRRCFGAFYQGYAREHQLSDAWLQRLPLFVDYRRLLLYTVFCREWGPGMNAWQRRTLSDWRRAILAGIPVVSSLL